jgi:S-formylglutathione hydrolase
MRILRKKETGIRRQELRYAALLVLAAVAHGQPMQYKEASMETKLVPGPLEYGVVLPAGYDTAKDPFPLVINLHGGGGSRDNLKNMQGLFEELWRTDKFPKAVIVTPSARRSFYLDYRDGSEKWETLIVGPFLEHVRKTYRVRTDRQGTLLFGISMGGLGGLRMAFKFPEKFAAVAALEPGVDPALEWKDVAARNRFWRAAELMETMFGKPFDEAYWAANNPATLAAQSPEKLRAVKIYMDAGNQDSFNLHEATEFLHRVLWDKKVDHEYHLVDGADHVGRTLPPRILEAFGFLERVLHPPPTDPVVENLKKQLAPLKQGIK